MSKKPAIFLDRDDTILYDKGYMHSNDTILILPRVLEGLRLLRSLDVYLILITNQSGITRGLFSEEEYYSFSDRMSYILKKWHNVSFDGIYHCPHSPEDHCQCRKPEIGLAHQAMRDFNIDLSLSWMIGDKQSDFEFASNLGIHFVHIKNSKSEDVDCTYSAKSLVEVATIIRRVNNNVRKLSSTHN